MKTKTRTLNNEPAGIEDIPEWNTVWTEKLVEVKLVPVQMFRDPFTLEPNKLVLCEVFDYKNNPAGKDRRPQCVEVEKKVKHHEPWFGMEQEYMLFDVDGKPFGWPPQGISSTGVSNAVGINKVYGRDICTCHYRACLYAGVKICGTNAEELPSQWEYQVGPCAGTEMGDHLWMSRYILHRVCEDFGVVASLDVQPIKGNSNTSGCHINFSTKEMRSEGGLKHIEEAITKLSKCHLQHLRVYDPHGGTDNVIRLAGQSMTSSYHKFSTGTACRNVSVRIPGHVSHMGCGYLEDRRPAANCDPYSVVRALIETCLLGVTEVDEREEEKKTKSA
ncbi:hypothetical protein INR49_025803 [Caranx melampygus]|nr:hypothetical protein INR49_025803 [Caranx melampygus]